MPHAPSIALPRHLLQRCRAAPPRPRAVDALTALLGLGLGVTIALGLTAESASSLAAPGGAWTFAGRETGLVGAHAMLVTVLLAGRIPVVERTLGQDRLIAWHRRLAPAALVLIGIHGVAIVLGYAGRAGTGVMAEAWTLASTLPGILAASVAFVLLAAVMSPPIGAPAAGWRTRPGGRSTSTPAATSSCAATPDRTARGGG